MVYVPKSVQQRRLHKAFLRYHDAANWPLLREALRRMGRADLIGSGKRHLIPAWQPPQRSAARAVPLKQRAARILTQHTGLPPQVATTDRGSRDPGGGGRPVSGHATGTAAARFSRNAKRQPAGSRRGPPR
jgi:hypothetical protein